MILMRDSVNRKTEGKPENQSILPSRALHSDPGHNHIDTGTGDATGAEPVKHDGRFVNDAGNSTKNVSAVFPFPLNDDGSVLHAVGLAASSVYGPVFGPLDMTLFPGDFCIVHGTTGSGRSALLLALTGHLRRTSGRLEVAGINAIENPYALIDQTGVGRIANYAAPDDRLSVAELIAERAYLEQIPEKQAIQRAQTIEQWLGFRVERGVLYGDLPAVEKSVLCAALAMLRPTPLVVVDDVDTGVPLHQEIEMHRILQRLASLDGNAIVVGAINGQGAPRGSLRVALTARKVSRLHKIDKPAAEISRIDRDPEPIPPVEVPSLDAGKVSAAHVTRTE